MQADSQNWQVLWVHFTKTFPNQSGEVSWVKKPKFSLFPYSLSWQLFQLSVTPTKFSAQVIFLLLCLSYLEGWAVYGSLSKINMWDVFKTTYRLFFLYVFVSEISYAYHLNGLPLVIVAWSFTEVIKHAHGLLTSYAFSPLLNNKWYQVRKYNLSYVF